MPCACCPAQEGETAAAINAATAAAAGEEGEEASAAVAAEIASGEFAVVKSPFVVRLSAFEAEMKESASVLHGSKVSMDSALVGLCGMFGEESDNAAWVLRTLATFSKQYQQATEANKTINDTIQGGGGGGGGK